MERLAAQTPARKLMYVSSWPGITLRELTGSHTGGSLPYPLSSPNRLSFCVARSGIYHLFRALNLKPFDQVLVPDYHSGNEVAAMRAAGASIVHYPIRRNLEPDLDALRRLAPGARVIYVIHYLGWPQPIEEIRALCREHGSLLVEDCALSMLSEHQGAPLGTFGDFSIFCLYKTLPVPNGGVLAQNREKLPGLAEVGLEDCPRTAGAGRSAELLLEALRSRFDLAGRTLFGIKRFVGRQMRAAKVRHVPVGDIGWDVSNVNIAMSPISERMIGRLDYAAIRRRRRENFQQLHGLLAGRVRMLRDDLPEGACPLFFPILVRDKPAAARALQQRGIGAVEFWNGDDSLARPAAGPDAPYLRKHVLELPIHQDVSPPQLQYIAAQVRQLEIEPA
jgi:dTDP-4-amino-4,6-dideoxygalactose transaminase